MDLQEAFDAGFDAVKAYVDKSFDAFEQRLVSIEARHASLPKPKDGKDADPKAVAEIVAEDLRRDISALHSALDALPKASELPDIHAMIAEAIEAAKPAPVDVKALLDEATTKINTDIGTLQTTVRTISDAISAPSDDVPAMIAEQIGKAIAGIPASLTPNETKAMVSEALAALPPAEKGKDADPALVASLVAETVERAVAALAVPKDGEPGADGVTLDELLPVIGREVTKAVSAIPVPKDGRNAVDLADMLVVEGGNVVATFTDGRTKVLGPFRGKDGEPGKDGRDVDVAAIEKLIDEKIAKIAPREIERDAYLAEFAPDDVASNVTLAVKMMAAMPQTVQTQQRPDAQPFNFSVTLPEMKASDTTVNVSLPEQLPPNVTVEPSVVNVAPANVHVETRRGKEVTKVTGWDKNGRITSFEKTEE